MRMFRCEACGTVHEGEGFSQDNGYRSFVNWQGRTYSVRIFAGPTSGDTGICAECLGKLVNRFPLVIAAQEGETRCVM